MAEREGFNPLRRLSVCIYYCLYLFSPDTIGLKKPATYSYACLTKIGLSPRGQFIGSLTMLIARQ